jgi:metal-responsive CopG/Arc/MetJ family transcriptional regulator
MIKKIIQVPVDDVLLKNLNIMSKKQHKARSELIRLACQRYLHSMEQEEMDMIYRRGYKSMPEQSTLGDSQIKMLGQVLSPESW